MIQKLLKEMDELEQPNSHCCPTRKRMDVQHHRPAAKLRGVFRTVVLLTIVHHVSTGSSQTEPY
eukprot:11584233-Prorocentrum_lima.AAC.1